ncbi:MAG: fimbrillin family protein [Clostridia bacterium]|jgi:hypothetical protein|nr:MAG: fimbrillin family protein [Clostridia bacterium]
MLMKTKYLTFAILAFMLFACSSEEEPSAERLFMAAEIVADIEVPAAAKSRSSGQNWSEKDSIGIMAFGEGANSIMGILYKNAKYITSSSGDCVTFMPANKHAIVFQDGMEEVTFSAYAPYAISGAATVLPGTSGVVNGQNTLDQTKQKTFDYLFASGAKATQSNPVVRFTGENSFRHMMTQLVLILELPTDGDGCFEKDEIQNAVYQLGGLKHNGTFNIKNGVATAMGDVVNDWVLPTFAYVESNPKHTYSFCLYPQTTDNGITFTITAGGQTHTTVLNPALAASTSYTYIITVKKKGLKVSDCTIASWGDGIDQRVDAV